MLHQAPWEYFFPYTQLEIYLLKLLMGKLIPSEILIHIHMYLFCREGDAGKAAPLSDPTSTRDAESLHPAEGSHLTRGL